MRIYFLAYWLSAKLGRQWRQKEQTIEIHNLLRQLQAIRLGQLQVHGKPFKTMVVQVPKDLNAILNKRKRLVLAVYEKCGESRKMAFVGTLVCVHEGESWTHRMS